MESIVSRIWHAFNDETSFLPFYVPLVIWLAAYAYSLSRGFALHKWHAVLNLHNFGAISLGLTSLLLDDNQKFNERISILWSMAYFAVDFIDCLVRLDRDFIIHATFCLILGYFNYSTPILRQLRMNSKASLCEMSTPIMYLAKDTRKPLYFFLFAVVFTLCRIVWIPVMIVQLLKADIHWTNPIQLALLGFYGLNWFWYVKIIKILVEGRAGKTVQKEE